MATGNMHEQFGVDVWFLGGQTDRQTQSSKTNDFSNTNYIIIVVSYY